MKHLTAVKLFVLATVLCVAVVVVRADVVDVRYLDTVAQSNATGTPLAAVGGHIAIDEQGAVYTGTPGGGSFLQKLDTRGRVLWSYHPNLPGFHGLAVDEQYLYTCGEGFYGRRQVMRFRRDSGEPAEGWQHEFDKDAASNGVRTMRMPAACVVDDDYLYIADREGDELRRLDKRTGQEAPYDKRVMVVEPRDLALLPDGHLLILTAESLLKIDRAGNPVAVPLIGGLKNPVAVAYHPGRDQLLIAEGGVEPDLLNQVRWFTLAGEPAEALAGRGGAPQGPWSWDAFAFSAGTGDVAVAPSGEVWINPGWSGKLGRVLRLLQRVDAEGVHQLTLMATQPDGLATGADGAMYLGGQMKLNLQGDIVWTCGLVESGSEPWYPATNPNWWNQPLIVGGRLFMYTRADGSLREFDPHTGRVMPDGIAMTGLSTPLVFSSDAGLYRLQLNGRLERYDEQAETWAAVAQLGPMQLNQHTDVAIDMQGSTLAVRHEDQVTAFALPGGEQLWQRPATGHVVVAEDMVITGRHAPSRPTGLVVLDLHSGDELARVADQATGPLDAVPARVDLTARYRDGAVHLAVAVDQGVRRYVLRRHRVE